MVSDNKTLTAINELFVLSPRHQSSFNRFFNRQPFDLELLHKCRLDMLQSNSQTKLKDDGFTSTKGVLSVDNSLLKHYGKHFHNPDSYRDYYHYDYVHKCYRWSHDLVTLYYSDNQTDYPVNYQLWEAPVPIAIGRDAVATFFKTKDFTINKAKWENRHKSGVDAQKWRNYIRARYRAGRKKHPAVVEIYQTKNHIAAKLIKKFCEQYPDKNLPIALDSGFTSAELCEQITMEFKRDYIGVLREDQYIVVKGEEMLIKTFISQLKKEHTDPESSTFSKQFKKVGYHYKGRKEACYAYIGNFRIRNFKKKQRIVISFLKKDLRDRPNITISNRTVPIAIGRNDSAILRIRRHRWPVETFHQEGKAEGLEKYQSR